MRPATLVSIVALVLASGYGGSPAAADAPEGCGSGLPAFKHNVGVVNPGESVWYTSDGPAADADLIGIMWFLTSLDADLYLWSYDCTEVWCASTNHADPVDACEETDCCGVGGYEVRYYGSVGGTPAPYELKWCWSYAYCVPY